MIFPDHVFSCRELRRIWTRTVWVQQTIHTRSLFFRWFLLSEYWTALFASRSFSYPPCHLSVQCFFPQYALPNIRTPYFILNSAYDVYQVKKMLLNIFQHLVTSDNACLNFFGQLHHNFVPPSSDPRGQWSHCKSDPGACSTSQIAILQGYILFFIINCAIYIGRARKLLSGGNSD